MPLMQNRPGQQLQPSISGAHCWLLRMQQTPDAWQVQRASGQLPQLPPHPSSPHASSPFTQFGVHGTHIPLVHFLPGGQPGQICGSPHESVPGPQAPGAHPSGVQVAGSPHTFGVPPPPHSSGDAQSPHWFMPPHVSGIAPQLFAMSLHFSGTHGHSASVVAAWHYLSSRQAMFVGQSNVNRQRTVHGASSGA